VSTIAPTLDYFDGDVSGLVRPFNRDAALMAVAKGSNVDLIVSFFNSRSAASRWYAAALLALYPAGDGICVKCGTPTSTVEVRWRLIFAGIKGSPDQPTDVVATSDHPVCARSLPGMRIRVAAANVFRWCSMALIIGCPTAAFATTLAFRNTDSLSQQVWRMFAFAVGLFAGLVLEASTRRLSVAPALRRVVGPPVRCLSIGPWRVHD
jgi:hypothetical protein